MFQARHRSKAGPGGSDGESVPLTTHAPSNSGGGGLLAHSKSTPASISLAPMPPSVGSTAPSRRGSYCLLAVGTLVGIGVILAVVGCALPGQRGRTDFENFVSVQGTEFMDGDRPFYIAGFNVDNIMEAAIPEVSNRKVAPGIPSGKDKVKQLLHAAAASGLNVLRTWAHTVDPAHALQKSPGQYREDVFQALDYVIAEAGAVGIRMELSFADQWRYRGGVGEYVDWSPSIPPRDPAFPPIIVQGDVDYDKITPERDEYEHRRQARFFTDPGAKEMYKAHMEVVLNRRNTFTGKIYKEDPTIMAFDLLNEPRCLEEHTTGCTEAVQKWIEEMAAHFKSIDTKHLLTVGEEGFFGPQDPDATTNPGAEDGATWAKEQGQDFVRNHAVADIDFAAIHMWPRNWFVKNEEALNAFVLAWMDRHAAAAARLSKPLFLEEVGLKIDTLPADVATISTKRDPVMKTVYRRVESSLANGGTLRGSAVWELAFRVYEESPDSPYGVHLQDSTFDLMAQHAKRVRTLATARGPSDACFTATSGFMGFGKQCVSVPSLCESMPKGQGAWDEEAQTLFDPGMEVYGSKEGCCRSIGGCGGLTLRRW